MISIQKTKNQEELDRRMAAPEEAEILQEVLELEKEKKEIILSLYDDWIYEYDVKQGRVTTISGNSSHYRFSESGGHGQTYLRLEDMHPEDRNEFVECCRGKIGGAAQPYAEARIKIDGEYRWISLTTRVLYDRNLNPVSVIGKISDIDAKKREELRLQEQATKDALTGLLNRAAFREKAEGMLRDAEERVSMMPALLIMDIDRFKTINDTYGHLFGDTVIVSVADAMKQVFGNSVLGRFGGDEFMVCLSVASKEELEQWILQFCKELSEELEPVATGEKITCSIGASIYGENGTTLDEMLHSADSALYYVKKNGKDGYAVCTEEMRQKFSSGEWGVKPKEPAPGNRHMAEEMTEFAMELLDGSKDLKSALNILLLKIGKRFSLASASIREYNEKGVPFLSYVWENPSKRPSLENKVYIPLEERKRIRENYKKNLLVEISDVEELSHDSGVYRMYKAKGIQALFQCPFVSEGRVFGYATYTDTMPREWKGEEKQSLTMISRIIGNYLAREQAYEKITRKVELMKSFDEITGLLKYDKFKEVAQTLLSQRNGVNYALVSVDFSNFKYFNEIYGFRSGDEVLEDFASLVAKHNPRAVAACRDYADNFLVMVIEKSQENLLGNVENYNKTFMRHQNERYMDSKLELCCGVYEIINPEAGIVHAIDNANTARKILKEKQGAGILLFEPSMRVNRMREIAILHMLEEAIDNREFCLYLQPKVSLTTGNLVGAEALARWEKADGQIVSPAEFIPPLEKSGKIVQLDFYMYELILKQLRQWKRAGYPVVPVSVNLSRHHIKDEALVNRLKVLLNVYGLESNLLEIEITESAFIEDQASLIQVMREIKDQGFGVSIDDFGTGYSSLSMLTEVPADIVKLDKEFLRHSESDVTRRMLQNVVRLIKDNSMRVVCEGVETTEQTEFLAETGCDIGQGYYFSCPIPAAQFAEKYFMNQ